jgi:RNA polymerase sigma-70 factor (ECF subfamily)
MADAAHPGVHPVAGVEAEAFVMDEEAFRLFYDRTARPLWSYLSRLTGDRTLADDLLQETYYRFLRARREYDDDIHRRNALYAIATNLARDAKRRERRHPEGGEVPDAPDAASSVAERVGVRTDLNRAMGRLSPRDRELLWLAYAHGFTHHEIASGLGLRTGSIKLLLSRARQRFMQAMRGGRR